MRNKLLFVFLFSYSSISPALPLNEFEKPVKLASRLIIFASASMLTVHLTHYTHEYAHYCLAELLYENANATIRYTGDGSLALPGALRFSTNSLSIIGRMIGAEKCAGIVHAGGDAANGVLIFSTLYLNSRIKSKVVAYIAVGNAINFLASMISGYYAYLMDSTLFTNFGRLKSDFQGVVQAFGPTLGHFYLVTLAYAGVRAFRHIEPI